MQNRIRVLFFSVLIISITMITGCNNDLSTIKGNNIAPSDESSNIQLDKTYVNEKYHFSLKYPGLWKTVIVDDDKLEMDPSGDVTIYINNDNDNYIIVFGYLTPISFPEQGMEKGEIVNNDGLRCQLYTRFANGVYDINVLYGDYHGAHVVVSDEKYKKYQDVIMNILKSVSITNKISAPSAGVQ